MSELIYVVLCVVYCTLYSDYARSKQRKLQDLAISKEHVNAEESDSHGVHNPIDLNDKVCTNCNVLMS